MEKKKAKNTIKFLKNIMKKLLPSVQDITVDLLI